MDSDFEIGESGSDFDASSEAMDARWEDDAPAGDEGGDDLVEVVIEDGDEVPEGAVVVEPDAEDGDEAPEEPAEHPEPDPEDSADEQPAAIEVPEKYQGKTPEEIARLAAESESYFGKKVSELEAKHKAEMEARAAQFEQLQRLLAEDVQSRQAQQAVAGEQGLQGELLEHALGDPVGAFNGALRLVAEGKVSDTTVDAVIDRVRDAVDGDLAADMRAYLTEQRVTAAAEARIQKEVEPLRRARYESEATRAVQTFASTHGEDFHEFKSELAEAMRPIQPELEKRGATATQIQSVLEHQLNLLRGQNPHRTAAYKEAVRKSKVDQQSETPSSPGAQEREVPLSAEEEYRQAALSRRESGAEELMAGFPGL
jgi:hypothetical protein